MAVVTAAAQASLPLHELIDPSPHLVAQRVEAETASTRLAIALDRGVEAASERSAAVAAPSTLIRVIAAVRPDRPQIPRTN